MSAAPVRLLDMHSLRRHVLLGFLATALPLAAAAQSAPPALSGTTLGGRQFSLQEQRGRVVMVVLWRTDCAVCLSKMPELRANAQGWKGKPFDLVTVSMDAGAADTQAYDSARRLVAAAQGPLYPFWHGEVRMPEEWRRNARLPLTLVIDREGRVAARHEGRMAPEVWDTVADLLP